MKPLQRNTHNYLYNTHQARRAIPFKQKQKECRAPPEFLDRKICVRTSIRNALEPPF